MTDALALPDFPLDAPGDLLGRSTLAVFNHDRSHRFWLLRIWERGKPLLVVCMANPSDADDERNDPTIDTLIYFATMWGYGGLLVVNLHSYVTSQPSAVKRAQAMGIDTCPPPNLAAWAAALEHADDQKTPVLVAWGNLGDLPTINRFRDVLAHAPTICLGTTQSGAPKHPMARGLHRIPRDFEPQPFEWMKYAYE